MRKSVVEYFAANVRERRLALGWSQEVLADEAGLHRTYIGALERAEKNVTLRTLEKLARALRCSSCDLLQVGPSRR